jgi:hypothetical protein
MTGASRAQPGDRPCLTYVGKTNRGSPTRRPGRSNEHPLRSKASGLGPGPGRLNAPGGGGGGGGGGGVAVSITQ